MGLKSTIFGPFFTVAPRFYSKFSQKFKNRGHENLVKNDKKFARFRAYRSILEFNVRIVYYSMFQGLKKATPFGCTWKLRLSCPSVRCVRGYKRSFEYENISWNGNYSSQKNLQAYLNTNTLGQWFLTFREKFPFLMYLKTYLPLKLKKSVF